MSAAQRWGFYPLHSCDLHSLYTVLTHAFIHAGWLHLIGNMWMLFIFGAALESRIGSARFAVIYLVSMVVAILAHSVLQTGPIRPAIGASGAVSGVLGCYIALYPRCRVLSLFFLGIIFFLTEVPGIFYVGVWLIMQIDGVSTQVLTGPRCSNIAWWAHIGGFLTGVVLGIALRFLKRRREASLSD